MSQTKAALKAAKSALDKQDYDEAVKQANQVIANDARNYFGQVLLGRALEKQGAAEPAIAAYETATTIKPGDELAWKGLCAVNESLGTKGVEGFTAASLELAKLLADKDDKEQCQTIVDKAISFAKEHGSRKAYKAALHILLPSSPIYEYLEGRIQPAWLTFVRLSELTETEEKEQISKMIGERRTRLGAKLTQVTSDVTREVFASSQLEFLYKDVINWTNDDELRREYEEKLFHRAYDHMLVLKGDAQKEKRQEVMKMAKDIVTIKHPFLSAWELYLEWKDVDDVAEVDQSILREFVVFFPKSGLARVLQGYLGESYVGKPSSQGAESSGDWSEDFTPVDAEERLLLLTDGLEDSKSSAVAHWIVSDHYRQIEEYEACINVCRVGLSLFEEMMSKTGLVLQRNIDSINTNLATSLVYYQAPKNHPEAKDIFNELLQRNSTSTAALLGLGLILEEQEQFDAASEFLQLAHQRDPDNARIGTEAAWCQMLNGDISSALVALVAFVPSLEKSKALDLKATTLYRIGRCKWELQTDRSSRKDRNGAYAHFIASLKANPSYAPSYTSLGIYYADYGKDKKRARQCFQKAFELSSVEVVAAERLARTFADDGQWEIVEIISQRVIDSGVARPSPGSKKKGLSWPFSALGIVQMNKQEYPKAVVSFQAALRLAPTDYNAWVGLGESYHSSGRYVAAEKTLEHARSLAEGGHTVSETSWFADYMLSNVQRELGDFEEAVIGYEEVLKARPDEFGVSISLLQTYVERAQHSGQKGFFGLAAQCSRAVLSHSNDMLERHSHFGKAFNFWKAIGDALAILASLPGRLENLVIESIKLLNFNTNGEWTGQINDSDGATPEALQSLLNWTESPTAARRVEAVTTAALIAYKCAISTSAHNIHAQAVAWYNLGWMELTSGLSDFNKTVLNPKRLLEAAVLCFKCAIELEAGNAEFWNALGIATTTLNPKVAQHSFVRSLHLNERSARTWTNLGVLYLMQDDLELAHSAFSRAQSTDPDYAHAWIGEGFVAMRSGNMGDALTHFTHADEISDFASLAVKSHFAISTFDAVLKSTTSSAEVSGLIQPIFALQQLVVQTTSAASFQHLLALLQERTGDLTSAQENLLSVCASMESSFEESEEQKYLANFALAKSDLARVCLAASNDISALEHAEIALDLTSDQGAIELDQKQCHKLRLSAHITAGLANYYLKSLEDSIVMFREALVESNSAPDLVCVLAQVLWTQGGDKEKSVARDQLFECIKKHPGHPQAMCLIGAMAAIDEDEATIEAVTGDLEMLRTDPSLTQAQLAQLERLLYGFAGLGSDSERAETEEAKISVMLSPQNPQGWALLANSAEHAKNDGGEIRAMAARGAMQSVPPHGTLHPDQLARALVSTGTAGDAQRAAMICPWTCEGWNQLDFCAR